MALIYISTNCIMSDLIKDKWIFLCASRETFHQPSKQSHHTSCSFCVFHTHTRARVKKMNECLSITIRVENRFDYLQEFWNCCSLQEILTSLILLYLIVNGRKIQSLLYLSHVKQNVIGWFSKVANREIYQLNIYD